MFPRWRELLAEGGELALTCFVGEAPLADARDDGLAFAPVRSAFLASDDEGAPPRSVAPEEMKAMLERAGFVDVAIISREPTEPDGFVFEATARKGAA